ncbi:MAG: hypothetical protein ABI977_11800 [Acidobacteriota bacterium]
MNTHGHDNHDNDQEMVESSGIKAKPILIFLLALAISTAVVFVVVVGLQYGFKKMDEMEKAQPATQMTGGRKLPPEPRLQGAPEVNPDKTGEIRMSQSPLDDMKTYNERINKQAASYDWADEKGGIARIPINRAKELIAEKGLPSLSDTAIKQIQAAETVRREVNNSDSNAGRGIKSQQIGTPQPTPATPAGAGQQSAPTAGQSPGEQPTAKPATATKAATGKQ